MLSFTAYAKVPEAWTKNAYSYNAKDQSLRNVLTDFSNIFGVRLQIDGLGTEMQKTINGQISTSNAKIFLERLALDNHFQWFVFNGTLYISPSRTQVSKTLDISEDAAPDLKEALMNIGLLDTRFGWGELPDEGIIMVSGPARYVEFVKTFSKKKKKGREKFDFMVFPLKYAMADDRQIQYRDQAIIIPGVATILNQVLDINYKKTESRPVSSNPNTSTATGIMQNIGMMQGMATDRLQQEIQNRNINQYALSQISQQREQGKSAVSADVRNNAIVIYDDKDRQPLYQSLIKMLDVPRNLIEIDAVILDIERSKVSELGINSQGKAGSVNFSVAPTTGSTATIEIGDLPTFYASIRALEKKGDASLVANPSILTIENQPAVIDFSEIAYIKQTGERVATVTPVTAGTSLQVVPRAINKNIEDQIIQLSLNIEDGKITQPGSSDSDSSTDTSDGTDNTPSVNKGTISTQAIISANRSLVIGGFKQKEDSKLKYRIPILGQIPLIGALFSYNTKTDSRRERIFILTPRLIGNEVNPAEYVADQNRPDVEKEMEELANKRGGSDYISRNNILAAFTSLVKGKEPRGFKQTADKQILPSDMCHSDNFINISDQQSEYYQGASFSVSIGIVENTGHVSRRFDESSCNSSATLAVTVWPDTDLAPGEKAELIIAHRNESALPARKTLLTEE